MSSATTVETQHHNSITGLSRKDLESLFHLPAYEAAIKLKLSREELRKVCKSFGIKRWPFYLPVESTNEKKKKAAALQSCQTNGNNHEAQCRKSKTMTPTSPQSEAFAGSHFHCFQIKQHKNEEVSPTAVVAAVKSISFENHLIKPLAAQVSKVQKSHKFKQSMQKFSVKVSHSSVNVERTRKTPSPIEHENSPCSSRYVASQRHIEQWQNDVVNGPVQQIENIATANSNSTAEDVNSPNNFYLPRLNAHKWLNQRDSYLPINESAMMESAASYNNYQLQQQYRMAAFYPCNNSSQESPSTPQKLPSFAEFLRKTQTPLVQ